MLSSVMVPGADQACSHVIEDNLNPSYSSVCEVSDITTTGRGCVDYDLYTCQVLISYLPVWNEGCCIFYQTA